MFLVEIRKPVFLSRLLVLHTVSCFVLGYVNL
jgi:hypothetical protein